jgi:hypothetical protein
MLIEWRVIDRNRHLVIDGKSVCGVSGDSFIGDAFPCEKCYKTLTLVTRNAFAEYSVASVDSQAISSRL